MQKNWGRRNSVALEGNGDEWVQKAEFKMLLGPKPSQAEKFVWETPKNQLPQATCSISTSFTGFSTRSVLGSPQPVVQVSVFDR